jgi:PAS domain S-box-containing protein
MSSTLPDGGGNPSDLAQLALEVADHVPAMLAYWNAGEICLFANNAYQAWFGKPRSEVVGSTMRSVLGPLYELNLPHIRRALAGEVQVFERSIPQADGSVRESLATYTPDTVGGVVRGFFVQIADVTGMKQLEREHERVIGELEAALREVRTLRGLLPICMHCKRIRDGQGQWTPIEHYVRARTEARFSHGICPDCMVQHYPDLDAGAGPQ